MNTGKNDYVAYKYDCENLCSYMLRDIGVRPENPLVEFYKSDTENLYFIRILAIIPNEIKTIFIDPPEARHKIETHLDTVYTRTIVVKWEEDIPPNAPSAFNLWSIDLEYNLLDLQNGDDIAINVIFEYDTASNEDGNIIKKLSRGTVTTSGAPPASDDL